MTTKVFVRATNCYELKLILYPDGENIRKIMYRRKHKDYIAGKRAPAANISQD